MLKILFAFAAVYVIWGSTYLAIRFGIETFPPWTLSALRFWIAGALTLALSLLFGEKALERRHNKLAAITGVFMISANGLVCVAEQILASGLVAVLVGGAPIWFMTFSWLVFNGERPSGLKMIGALVGLSGIVLIARDSLQLDTSLSTLFALFCMLGSTLVWTVGSLLQRQGGSMESGLRFSALQMLSGAVAMSVFSLALESPWRMDVSQIQASSWYALAYLIVFGSVIGFCAYSFLARQMPPHLVSTYALVNPVIAVALGAMVYHEPVTSQMVISTFIVLLGLALLSCESWPWFHRLRERLKLS